MSNKATVMGPRGPEKIPGWFSWRHQTAAEHDVSREAYLEEHGPNARRFRAALRLIERNERGRDGQLEALAARPGSSLRERTRIS